MNSVFSLRALAAQKTPQMHDHRSCFAAEKPVIHARRSETNPANSQIADKAAFRCTCVNIRFPVLILKRT